MLPRRGPTLLASTIPTQTGHVVGPGGFAGIFQAINAAANGEVIVVHSGMYFTFTSNKDLTLTAAPGAVVDVRQAPWAATPGAVFQPPTFAKVSGIRFR